MTQRVVSKGAMTTRLIIFANNTLLGLHLVADTMVSILLASIVSLLSCAFLSLAFPTTSYRRHRRHAHYVPSTILSSANDDAAATTISVKATELDDSLGLTQDERTGK